MTRRLIAFIAAALICICAGAQNIVSDFTATLQGKCAAFKYAYSLSGKYPVNGSGEVRLQGDSFTMKGDGLEVYCNGNVRWTVDTEAEECYIEAVDAKGFDVEANPALLVGAVDKAFTFKKSSPTTFNGEKVTQAVLAPISTEGNISEVSLMLTSAKKPLGAIIHLNDGTIITITIHGFTLGAPVSAGTFSFNTGMLDKHYVVTDLR